MQISVAPNSTASWIRPDELLLVVLVGVGRALALAEAAERAADGADVRDVDVAVDDERHRSRRPARRAAHPPPRACPRSPPAASRRTAPSAPPALSASPSRAALDRARDAGRADRRPLRRSVRPDPRRGMKRPVRDLDHVDHRPARSTPGRCTRGYTHRRSVSAKPSARSSLAHLVRRGERVLGRDVIAVGAQAAQVGRAGAPRARPTSPTGSAGPGSRRPASAAASRRSAASCPRW